MRYQKICGGLVLMALLMTGCAQQPPEEGRTVPQISALRPKGEPLVALDAIPMTNLPGFFKDTVSDAIPALRNSCTVMLDPEKNKGDLGSPAVWRPICGALKQLPPENDEAARTFLKEYFTAYRLRTPELGLFTGYYEPELEGSLVPTEDFPVPLYGPPEDLVHVPDLGIFHPTLKGKKISGRVVSDRFVPYYSRKEIEEGALHHRVQPLLWLAKPEEAFFLHIQGSGRIRLPNGDVVRVGYHSANGHSYEAIGKFLMEMGEIPKEEMSMQAIKKWIQAHPEAGRDLMHRNPSYVFFKRNDLRAHEGPVGAQGVPLTPRRSLAVDRTYLPLGTLLWLDVDHPLKDKTTRRIQGLVVAQDTGGAIRGLVRGDLFWGSGVEAESLAGPMRSQGLYYVLLPKSVRIQEV